jgi:C-terminal processing protease CtpA/Prc
MTRKGGLKRINHRNSTFPRHPRAIKLLQSIMTLTGRCVIILLLVFLQLTASAQIKITRLPKKDPASLREDFSLLQKILEANHPSLYWYTPKDSINALFAESINSITDSLDEVQFKNKVALVISRIRCGHTTVLFSKAFTKKAAAFRYPAFPLNIKAWDDSLVVLNSLQPGDSIFKRGTIITGINGMKNRKLLDTLFQFISSDGYAMNYKNQVVSGNFPAWYKTIIGLDSAYSISYIDSAGSERTATVKNVIPKIDTSKKETAKLALPVEKPSRRQIRKADLLAKRNMVIDTALNTAFIHLSTFSSGGLRSFFRQSFKTIKKQNIQHVVIDLRENGGGKVNSSILLAKYLSDHPFKVGDSVVAISRKFKYASYIHPSWAYWFAMNFGSKKKADGLIHFSRYENKLYEPKTKYHFDGQLTLVQGGYTFSATAIFISSLKGQKNTTLVGEETGGGYYGSSAMYLPTIVLPNSRLRVTLPMYRLVMDATRPKGHGIVPDIEIPPSSIAIKEGIDLKMKKIREMIQAKTL